MLNYQKHNSTTEQTHEKRSDVTEHASTASAENVTRPEFAELERRLAKNWPVENWRDSHVVLAVSGGADSVAVLRAMIALKVGCGGTGRLFAAHLNHCLRGNEADADAAWLTALCERLGLPLEVGKVDVSLLANDQGDGREAAARAARYGFLQQTAERLGARFVATAHNADDQTETVLHRILRGTGLAGLAGIPGGRPLSPSVALVRPLLAVKRREIDDYLAELGQDFRADTTNEDSRFTRNRLRHDLLPLLREKFNSEVDDALLRLATQAGETQQVIEALAEGIVCDCVVIEFDSTLGDSRRGRRLQMDCRKLAAQPAIIVREVCKISWREARWPLQAMGFHEWQLLARLVSGECAKTTVNLPSGIQARREHQLLILEAPSLP
jgi:tRNA(Ile)-lysidine synthase